MSLLFYIFLQSTQLRNGGPSLHDDLRDHVKLEDIMAFLQDTESNPLGKSLLAQGSKASTCTHSSPLLQERNEILEILPGYMKDDP